MQLNSLFARLIPLAIACALPTLAAANTTYTVLQLGTLGGGNTRATGINASGQVVGYSTTTSWFQHAFITGPNGQGLIDLGTLGGANVDSYAAGVNDSGQVVGASTTASRQVHAFITGPNGQGLTDIGTLGGVYSIGTAVNASGQVAGNYIGANGIQHTFITGPNGQDMRDFGTLGDLGPDRAFGINASGQVVGDFWTTSSPRQDHAFVTGPNGLGLTDLGALTGAFAAAAINASGQVVGDFWTASGREHAFITGPNGLGFTDLGVLGTDRFSYTEAIGINASGQVVGAASADSGYIRAFVTGPNGLGLTDLNSLVTLPNGDFLSSARGINDAGQIIANSINGQAYLLTPVPEPGSYLMAISGLAVIAVSRRRAVYGSSASKRKTASAGGVIGSA